MSHNIRALIALTILASTLSLHAQSASVTGTITYRERMALPPGSTVEVTLEDVSRADAPAEVIARLRESTPGQPPIPFQLSFDPNRINARNRYAVRARIFDGARLLFTSTTTTLVLTQGRGTTANLVLQRAAASQEPEMSTPDPRPIPPVSTPIRPLPPVVELRNLPATFTGNVPCDGCPGVRYELNLYPDDTFFVRNTRMVRGSAAEDDLGSWVLSSDRRVIILRMASGGTERFAIRDNTTLRRLDARGRESEGGQAQDLRRVTFNPLDVRVTVSGAYAREGGEARLIECSTGQVWRVTGDGLPPVATRQPGRAGNGVGTFITVNGRLTQGAGGREPEFKVERVETAAMSTLR